ncbi:MAG: PQQ-dependent sugar dehydrogenase [Patescibacteria group bacterium]
MKSKVGLFLTIILAGIGVGGFYFWKNFRGAAPAFLPASIKAIRATSSLPFNVPEGFSISVYAKDLGTPRVLEADPLGNLLVSVPSEGKIMAIINQGENPSKIVTMIRGLNSPHGLVSHCYNVPQGDGAGVKEWCALLVAEENRVSKFTYEKEEWNNFIAADSDKNEPFALAGEAELLVELPGGGRHITRTILFKPMRFDYEESPGTTGQLFISIGSACDVCHESDVKRAVIMKADIDFSRGPKAANMVVGEPKIYAKGLRNSVFMALNPETEELWATEMGQDKLGDDLPPDEINIIRENQNYGWPICYGKNIHDTVFDKNTYIRNPCLAPFEIPSQIDLPAHSAPLGLAFVPDSWGGEYENDLLVAYHGSWNRSAPTGYKVARLIFDEQGNYTGSEDLITGWLADDGKTAIGRPAGLLFGRSGELYVSDDKAGVVYKIIH